MFVSQVSVRLHRSIVFFQTLVWFQRLSIIFTRSKYCPLFCNLVFSLTVAKQNDWCSGLRQTFTHQTSKPANAFVATCRHNVKSVTIERCNVKSFCRRRCATRPTKAKVCLASKPSSRASSSLNTMANISMKRHYIDDYRHIASTATCAI